MITESINLFRKGKIILLQLAVIIILFSISANSHVLLNAPNGGEQFFVNTQATIQWRILIQHATVAWDLHYSTTGTAGPWKIIKVGLPPGNITTGTIHNYNWTIPDDVSNQVRVRVIMVNEIGIYLDFSDADLSILPTTLQLFPILPQMVKVGEDISLEIMATNEEGNTPVLTSSTLPANSSFTDNGDGTGLFEMSPTFSQIGMYELIFVATDGAQADSELVTISVNPCCVIAGDFDGNNVINIADLTTTINWLFKSGSEPSCKNTADVNSSCSINISDLTVRVNYMFKGGSDLVCGCVE